MKSVPPHRSAALVFLLLVYIFSGWDEASGQEAIKPSLEATPAEKNAIRLDGLLSEGVWQSGEAASGFIQQESTFWRRDLWEEARKGGC